jgi:NAD(P)-dependent dehydrogenase (short-subunit alcohol dehydrogenase family)
VTGGGKPASPGRPFTRLDEWWAYIIRLVPNAAAVLIAGASSGIGFATAERLAAHGFRVFGASRTVPVPLPAGLRDAWVAMDVRDEDSVRAGVESVVAAAGRLDAVVSCAGCGVFGSVEELPMATARAQLETNFLGTLAVLRASLPHLRSSRGRAVVVGSLAGRAPIPFQAHYSATKAALDALTLALRLEVAPLGVSVSLVEPGDIRTPFNDHTDWGAQAGSAYAERQASCERLVREALPQAPGPEVVAEVIHRAFVSARPRVRYTVGPNSLLVPLGRRLLPDWLTLRLIRSHFKI